MYSKIKQFLDAAPSALKSANEIYNFARNKYKQVMGFFPDGLDDVFLKRGSAEMQDVRNKVVKFDDLTPDPRIKQPKGAKVDTIRAHENIAGGSGYAEGDTKYNADILGEELARMRGFIKEGQDSTDMDPMEYSKLYDEAYSYLTGLRMLNRKPRKEGIKKLIESGDITIGTAPKTTKTKPKVDPELQAMEDQNKMFQDFSKRTETD